jgi:hypothetical protein
MQLQACWRLLLEGQIGCRILLPPLRDILELGLDGPDVDMDMMSLDASPLLPPSVQARARF